MPDFISWKRRKSDRNIFFLTDNEVFSPLGRKVLAGVRDSDILGCRAIETYYGAAAETAKAHGYRNFWNKFGYPREIAKHLESPETLKATWGKMLEMALHPNDALYILTNAPELWRSALLEILLGAIAKDADCSYRALCAPHVFAVGEKREILVGGVARSTERSYDALHYLKNLTERERDILVGAVAKDAEYSYEAICYLKGFTERQRDILVDGVAGSPNRSYDALLRKLDNFTQGQRNILIDGVAKSPERSYDALRNLENLAEGERNIFVNGVANNGQCSHDTLRYVRGLTYEQRKLLRKASGQLR